MKKQYLSAPLPFVGQKRIFAKEFAKVLEQYPEDAIFVDLFGGSGLLSHIAKCKRPNATVVYNDFDNYRKRLENIPQTNKLLADLREIVKFLQKCKRITGEVREQIFNRIREEETKCGFVDYITLSSSLLFGMNYCHSLEQMEKETLINEIRKTDYPLCEDYLDGITVTCCDYNELFDSYKDAPEVVFLIDPPYLSTEVGMYKMYWKLGDYLDVLRVLQGHSFVYFTSNKSAIVELCEWMGRNPAIGNPFERCRKSEFNTRVTHNAGYTDMMFYCHPSEPTVKAA